LGEQHQMTQQCERGNGTAQAAKQCQVRESETLMSGN